MGDWLRPWRDSAFRIQALALLVAALALCSVILLRAELESRFAVRSAEVLGGDLILEGSAAPEASQLQAVAGLRQAQSVEFATVIVHSDEFLLVAARAVDGGYPLFGDIQIATDRFSTRTPVQQGPPPGEIWVADQVLDRLRLQVGDQLDLGRETLRISAVLRQEPDQGAAFYSMNPRVLFHMQDLPATGVLGPGTRATHRLLLTGTPAELANAETTLQSSLRPNQKLQNLEDAALGSLGPLRQIILWVSLGVLLVTLLCGAAIHLATTQRVHQRARLSALLRCFGASRRQVVQRLLLHEFTALLPASLAGSLLGIMLIMLLRHGLGWSGTLPDSILLWCTMILAPLLLWISFGLPRLTALIRVPAMQVLNSGSESRARSAPLELLAALAAPVVLAALLTGSLADLGELLLWLVILTFLLPMMLWPILRILDSRSHRFALATRVAVRRLSRRPAITLPLLASLTVSMLVLAMAGQTGSRLLDDWRTTLPEQAPNYFIFNLFSEDLGRIDQWITEQKAIPQPLYPVVRGRLTSINDRPVRDAVTKESDQAERALNRDLVLTEAETLAASNNILQGQWFDGVERAEGHISVESQLAEGLGIGLGDRLQFTTSQGLLEGQVSSIRTVDWDSFEPNFYFIFSPGSLAAEDITWLTSFWLPEGDGRRLAELLRRMPHATLLDVNAILDQAQDIVAQASRATALLAILLMSSALLVLVAALLGGQESRGRDNALLRTLGARHRLIKQVELREFLLLGGGAAMAATLILALTLYPLGKRLFDGQLPLSLWLLLPTLLGALVLLTGAFFSRSARHQPPLLLLRHD